jgi:hypothetical protein
MIHVEMNGSDTEPIRVPAHSTHSTLVFSLLAAPSCDAGGSRVTEFVRLPGLRLDCLPAKHYAAFLFCSCNNRKGAPCIG